MKNATKAHLFVLAANIIYGINYSIGKIALASIPAFAIVCFRVVIAALIFWILHALFSGEKIERSDHRQLLPASLFGVVINQLLFFKGLSLTSEMHSALIMITTPLLVLLMAWILLKDRITLQKTSGILLGATGVALLIISGTADSQSTATAWGDICIMLNATSYAIFLVIAKPLMKKYHPLTLAKWIFIYAIPPVLIIGWSELSHLSFATIPTTAWLALTVVVLGATVLAYLFNILGLQYGSPTLVSIYIYTQPIIASLIALIAGNETITWQKIISALLVFSGVALVSVRTGATKSAT
ncbi:MAG TPA: DMT family transporter [Chitinophagales bacterium]|nr:DMT family transporter [Chitinophagales bacterium]